MNTFISEDVDHGPIGRLVTARVVVTVRFPRRLASISTETGHLNGPSPLSSVQHGMAPGVPA